MKRLKGNTMAEPFVAILKGSDSDLPKMEPAFSVLKSFDIEVKVTSAPRTPKATHDFVTGADQRGCQAFICAADPELAQKLIAEREANAQAVMAKDAALQEKLKG
ncbi:MAG: phosphoribosylcarboxyaminoimidazole (NCAIR) mutase [Oceanicoccus sp.]